MLTYINHTLIFPFPLKKQNDQKIKKVKGSQNDNIASIPASWNHLFATAMDIMESVFDFSCQQVVSKAVVLLSRKTNAVEISPLYACKVRGIGTSVNRFLFHLFRCCVFPSEISSKTSCM